MSQTRKGRATTSRKGGASTKKPRLVEEEETKRLYTLGNKENLQTTNIVGLAALDVQQAKLNVLPRFYEEVEVTALQEDDAHSQLKELGARLDQLAEENNSLKERVVALEKDNTTLNERNTRLNERVVALEKDNTTLNERVANLERHRQEIINTATQSTPTRGH
ncbi:hypothetical protein QOT17_012344 [Balamuthia mandrillaris]